jgi:phenylacetate-CoA ligase
MTTRHANFEDRRRCQGMWHEDRVAMQLEKLNGLLAEILPKNRFYAEKLGGGTRSVSSLEEFSQWPFTFKEELIAQQRDGQQSGNLTYPFADYVRYHQTSGTRGRPLMVFDTPADWRWWVETWQYVWDVVELSSADRVLMAFSFGPFIGFWTAKDAALARGSLVIPGGGLSSIQRLELLRRTDATVLCCTPSYALHLAEIAAQQKFDLNRNEVRAIIVAGEPGGSLSTVRERIERAWGATVVDHAGASEVGPWGVGDPQGEGLYVIESEFIAEFLAIESGQPAEEGELAELVLTPLGRYGFPVIRYRTGDLVRPSWKHGGESSFVFLPGGVVGRADDMLIVRGVNVFPSSLEQILHGFPEIVEFRVTVRKQAEMDDLTIEVEDRLFQPERIARELRLRLGLRVQVTCVPLGSLPRSEGKSRRIIDLRSR